MAYTITMYADQIIADVSEAVDEATALTALAIENDTKREAPVRGAYRSFRPKIKGKKGQQIGGTLRRSYTTAKPGTEGSITGTQGLTGSATARGNVVNGAILVGSWLGYAYFVERGTSKMAKRPHFQPAIDKNMPLYTRKLEAAYKKRAKQYGG